MKNQAKAGWTLFVVAAAAVAVALCVYDAPHDIDSGSYVGLAEGKVSEVHRPYANRMLHPIMVRAVAAAFGTSPAADNPAWWLVQIVSLTALLGGAVALVSRFLFRDGGGRAFALAAVLLASPLWYVWGGNPYIQDVPLAALGTGFFLALLAGRNAVALVLLALMVLTRESSVVVAAALFASAIVGRKWRLAAGTAVATVAAMAGVAFLSRESPGNLGGMGAFAYMITKVAAAGCSNLLGLPLWTDVHAQELPWFYPDAPLWSMTLPDGVHVGRIHRIGVYAFRPWNIVQTLGLWALPLASPAVALCISRKFGTLGLLLRPWRLPLPVMTAVLSGAAFWLLQPFSGYSPWRYLGYAWPIAWIAVPWLISSARPADLQES